MNIWGKLKKDAREKNEAFTVLAPMEDVTDNVFRQIIQEEGRPDLFMTEFTNCDGICSPGREKVIHRLNYDKSQLPIIGQIWGSNPDNYPETTKIVIDKGFSGVDINMGCPVAKVVRRLSGAGMIKSPELAKQVIDATRDSIIENKREKDFAFSIKTRIGINSIDLDWIKFLLEQKLDALSIHLRTVKEQSKVPAHWELMPQIIEMKEKISPNTVIIGNGDIKTRGQIKSAMSQYGVDGVMIGRGIFENLWIFNDKIDSAQLTKEKRLNVLLHHMDLFVSTWGNSKNFQLLKKFFKVYLKGFDGATQLRNQLIRLQTHEEIRDSIEEYLSSH